MSLSAISEIQVSKIFSCGPPFVKMPKMSDFLCLGNLWLRCVGTVVSGNKPFSLNYLIRTFIPSEFQWHDSLRWAAAAFQKVH